MAERSRRRTATVALIATMVAACSATSDCSGDSGNHKLFTETGAAVPDACTLITGSLPERLVGDYTVKPAKQTAETSDCNWQAPLSSHVSKPNGYLDVSAITEVRRRTNDEKYRAAKANYRGQQEGKFCYKLETSADDACWQKGSESLTVILRKGYTVLRADYSAVNSPALEEENMEATATMLAREMLTHLRS